MLYKVTHNKLASLSEEDMQYAVEMSQFMIQVPMSGDN